MTPGFRIADRRIALDAPTYFIADIAANHDGDLTRAKRLIRLAKDAGADAAKFQHFKAPQIVSRAGFESLGGQFSHQAKWRKPVYEVYQDASVPRGWTGELKAACDDAGIHFFSTPYDFEAVDLLAPLVPAFKIGSGDITWHEFLQYIAEAAVTHDPQRPIPIILSTGASDIGEVQRAVDAITSVCGGPTVASALSGHVASGRRAGRGSPAPHGREVSLPGATQPNANSKLQNPKSPPPLALLQCNTNYTGDLSNFDHVHLNVLKTYQTMFPHVITGLSDHTPGHATVLGAVALGGRIIEKHFTDDVTRDGPDHKFSMTPETWRDMVDRTRELERALGSAQKFVAENERDTVVLQRRCLRAARDLPAGHTVTRADFDVLRPAPAGALPAGDLAAILGKRTISAISAGTELRPPMLE